MKTNPTGMKVVAWIAAEDLEYVRKGVDQGSITCVDAYGTDDVPIDPQALVTLADAEAAKEQASNDGHYAAIRWVLGHLNLTGDRGSTTYEEILKGCGREEIIRSAIEDDELEFTGLGEYIRLYGTRSEKRMLRAALSKLGEKGNG